MRTDWKKVLFVGPHSDDVEFGCGALIHRWIRQGGIEARLLTLTAREKTTGEKYENALMYQANACKALGLPPEAARIERLPTRALPHLGEEIRQILTACKKDFNPDLVFTTTFNDRMQDHHAVADETYRIFRDTSILEYEVVSSTLAFTPNVYFEVGEEDLERKISALHCFEEQAHKDYFKPDVIKSLARLRGAHSRKYVWAEAFVARNLLL